MANPPLGQIGLSKMIRSIRLRFGAAPGLPALSIDEPGVTILVGPNNAGKSRALLEIRNFCASGKTGPEDVIVDQLTFSDLSEVFAQTELKRLSVPPQGGESVSSQDTILGVNDQRLRVNSADFVRTLTNPNSFPDKFARYWLGQNLLNLDGANRLQLVSARR